MAKRAKQSPELRASHDAGWRLAIQKRKTPIEWKPGQREALIAQAVSAGKVQKCPAGHADGILIFNAGGSMRPTFGAHKSGAA